MTATLGNPLVLLFGLFLVVAALLVIGAQLDALQLPAMPQPQALHEPLPALTEHALRHDDAAIAWNWVNQRGRFCRHECPDGRDRFICPMPDHRWAIVVLDQVGGLVTSFTSDQDYARGWTDFCHNPWRMAHP